eukprot:scaffold63_cov306-Pinguiococcus_pyrenoidosus.AAC.87
MGRRRRKEGEESTNPAAFTGYLRHWTSHKGAYVFMLEWHRPLNTLSGEEDPGEDARLMFGMLFSLKEIVGKMSGRSAEKGERREDIQVMRTSTYSTHLYETQTGLRFVLNVDAAAPSLRGELEEIYAGIFVEKVQ